MQTLCTMSVGEGGSVYRINVPAFNCTFTGPTEADVCAQATEEGVWAETLRPDGSDSACVDFGFHVPAVQALMVAAAADADADAGVKRARTMTLPLTLPITLPLSESPVSASHDFACTFALPVRTAWEVCMRMPITGRPWKPLCLSASPSSSSSPLYTRHGRAIRAMRCIPPRWKVGTSPNPVKK